MKIGLPHFPHATFVLFKPLCLQAALVLLLACLPALNAQVPPSSATNSDLLHGIGVFKRGFPFTTPWAGVDGSDFLHCLTQSAPLVMSNGQVQDMPYPVSVAVADLNGDHLPDLIVADPAGIVWFFPNSGTPTEPKFTFGEIIPIWVRSVMLGQGGGEERSISCNSIYVTDFNDDGAPDIIIGTFMGEVFFIPNTGTPTSPHFSTPADLKDLGIPTRSDGKLWGTFFTPIYVDFTKSGHRDLILGEGTYSANNIYYFPNGGSSSNPRFSEKTRQILIPGMGREHLTPQMVDWNNDGIPDIMTGERDGSVSVFLCKSNDPKKFEFDDPIQVKFGSSSKLGTLSNPVPVDFNGDGLFDILVGHSNGRIGVAYNKGTPGSPVFDMPVDIKGTQIYPKFLAPTGWTLLAPAQSTYHVFHLVSGESPENLTGQEKDRATLAYEPGFALPQGSTSKYAAKLEFLPSKSKTFTTLLPVPVGEVYKVSCDGSAALKPDTNYEIRFAVKGSGNWTSADFHILGVQGLDLAKGGTQVFSFAKAEPFSVGSSWSSSVVPFRFSEAREVDPKQKANPIAFSIWFSLVGKGVFYLDDVTITEVR